MGASFSFSHLQALAPNLHKPFFALFLIHPLKPRLDGMPAWLTGLWSSDSTLGWPPVPSLPPCPHSLCCSPCWLLVDLWVQSTQQCVFCVFWEGASPAPAHPGGLALERIPAQPTGQGASHQRGRGEWHCSRACLGGRQFCGNKQRQSEEAEALY